jgi:prepilin-type processing-associated H-X9-DG protein
MVRSLSKRVQVDHHRDGLSLTELVVVLAAIGMLIGLLLPAVMSARESARNVSCQNNLHQIGLAMSNYSTVHRAFPPSLIYSYRADRPFPSDLIAAHARLLPYLEEQSLYNTVEFGVIYQTNPARNKDGPNAFRCPSDSYAKGPSASYVMCSGENLLMVIDWMPSIFKVTFGAFEFGREVRLEAFGDGITNTVTFGECLVGTRQTRNGSWGRDVAMVELGDILPNHRNRMASLCSQLNRGNSGRWITDYGAEWIYFNGLDYNHVLPPNSGIQDCGSPSLPYTGLRAARSLHQAKCNFVFADGRVAAITNDVDIEVYRAISTRNGHESNHIID